MTQRQFLSCNIITLWKKAEYSSSSSSLFARWSLCWWHLWHLTLQPSMKNIGESYLNLPATILNWNHHHLERPKESWEYGVCVLQRFSLCWSWQQYLLVIGTEYWPMRKSHIPLSNSCLGADILYFRFWLLNFRASGFYTCICFSTHWPSAEKFSNVNRQACPWSYPPGSSQ